MNKSSMPKSIGQGLFTVFGVTLHCHVLDNGDRVIEADDMRALLDAMAGDCGNLDEAEIARFRAFMRGEMQ